MIEEISHAVESLRSRFEALAVRGLRTASTDDLALLRAAVDEFDRIGAAHLAGRIGTVVKSVESGDAGAAAALLRAMTSLRLFDRVLTLDVARVALGAFIDEPDDEEP